MDGSIGIAQVGVGYWGPNLLRNLAGHPKVRLQAVVDQDASRREYVESLYPGVNTLSDMDVVLSDDTVDAVVLATPAATHFELVCRVLEAGKHVLVEKPMATSVDEIDRISELSQNSGKVAMARGYLSLQCGREFS